MRPNNHIPTVETMFGSIRTRSWILLPVVVTALLAYAAATPEPKADTVIPLDELAAVPPS